MRRATLGLLLALVAAAGCSGHNEPKRVAPAREGGDEEAEREQAARGLPAADRVAYYQVATAIGSLRGRASLVALGRRGARRADAAVRASIPRLRALHPNDGALLRLRAGALVLARQSTASPLSGAAARLAARRQLAAANRLSVALDGLVRTDPRFSALVPD